MWQLLGGVEHLSAQREAPDQGLNTMGQVWAPVLSCIFRSRRPGGDGVPGRCAPQQPGRGMCELAPEPRVGGCSSRFAGPRSGGPCGAYWVAEGGRWCSHCEDFSGSGGTWDTGEGLWRDPLPPAFWGPAWYRTLFHL